MATEKNGNGRNGNRKIGQREKSATKNERVGKQGNTKLMHEITATEKRERKKRQRENGQRKIMQRENSAAKIEMIEKKGNSELLSEITKTEKATENGLFQLPFLPLPFFPFTIFVINRSNWTKVILQEMERSKKLRCSSVQKCVPGILLFFRGQETRLYVF